MLAKSGGLDLLTNTDTPAAARAFIERQLDTWAQAVKANGIEAD